jgi:hypothetical protein
MLQRHSSWRMCKTMMRAMISSLMTACCNEESLGPCEDARAERESEVTMSGFDFGFGDYECVLEVLEQVVEVKLRTLAWHRHQLYKGTGDRS